MPSEDTDRFASRSTTSRFLKPDTGEVLRLPIPHLFNRAFLSHLHAHISGPQLPHALPEAYYLFIQSETSVQEVSELRFTPEIFQRAREAYTAELRSDEAQRTDDAAYERWQEERLSDHIQATDWQDLGDDNDPLVFEKQIGELQDSVENSMARVARDPFLAERDDDFSSDATSCDMPIDDDPGYRHNAMQSLHVNPRLYNEHLARYARALRALGLESDVAVRLAECRLRVKFFLSTQTMHSADASLYISPFCKQIEKMYRNRLLEMLHNLPLDAQPFVMRHLTRKNWTLASIARAFVTMVIMSNGEWPSICQGKQLDSLLQSQPKRPPKLTSFQRQEIEECLRQALGSVTRAAWIALCLDHLRIWYRNGYVHDDDATSEAVISCCRTLFRPCRMLSFMASVSHVEPTSALKAELCNLAIAKTGIVSPPRIQIDTDQGLGHTLQISNPVSADLLEASYYENLYDEWRPIGRLTGTRPGAIVVGSVDSQVLIRVRYLRSDGQGVSVTFQGISD